MHERARKRLVAELIEANARGARRTDCKRCGAPCITGDDHDSMAITVTVDEEPLQDGLEEMLAIEGGRATYDLVLDRSKTSRAGQQNLWHREPWHYLSRKPWGVAHGLGTVHVEHRCEEGNT